MIRWMPDGGMEWNLKMIIPDNVTGMGNVNRRETSAPRRTSKYFKNYCVISRYMPEVLHKYVRSPYRSYFPIQVLLQEVGYSIAPFSF